MRSPQQRDRLHAVQIDIETGPTSARELKRIRAPVICIDAPHIKAVANQTLSRSEARANEQSVLR